MILSINNFQTFFIMEYSFWSGELQGIQEIAMEEFEKEQTFSNARITLAIVLASRSDFLYYKSRGMVTGELLPFDWRLVRNLFIGAKNSLKAKLK